MEYYKIALCSSSLYEFEKTFTAILFLRQLEDHVMVLHVLLAEKNSQKKKKNNTKPTHPKTKQTPPQNIGE